MGNPVRLPAAWLILSLLLAVPPRLPLTLWHMAGVVTGAVLTARTASAQPCQGCDCCPETQDCVNCPGLDDPVCCPMGWRCLKDFFSLSIRCVPPCPIRAECTGSCSDGEGECFIGCCSGTNEICDHQNICTGDPCPEEDRCGKQCCNPGVTCVDDQCSDGCASPCGAGETCQGGQCLPGAMATPTPMSTPATTPTGMLGATVTATPTTDPEETPAPPPSRCDVGKLGCVAKRQACLLKVHATAEKKGEALAAEGLQKCIDGFGGCIAKLESKQNPAKPKTLCSTTGDLGPLSSAGDGFVTGAVTAIHPSFPAVGPPSACDAGKKSCVAKRATCLLKIHAVAVKEGALVDPAAVAKCTDAFDGGAKGFAKGCVGKLQGKQDPAKPKTICAVTDDGSAVATLVDAFVAATTAAVLDLD